MTYRDPRGAQFAKIEALERELDEARRELERLQARADGESDADERAAERSRMPLGAPPARPGVVLAMMATAIVATSGAAIVSGRGAYTRHPHPYGCPRRAMALYGSPYGDYHGHALYEPVQYAARLTSVEGGGPDLAAGAACTVRVSPVASAQFNCRVEVRCGAQTLYGASRAGYARCAFADERPSYARDVLASGVDGDPRLEFDMHRRLVRVAEDGEGKSLSAVLTLDPESPAN